MYQRLIEQLAVSVGQIETWLEKAERFAAEKRFNVQVLMDARLAPDMGGFVYQVQSACDYLKGGAGWLAGQQPPSHLDTEKTISEIRERIRKTLDYVRSVPASDYANAADQRVRVSWLPANTVIEGENYLAQIVIPNIYFHVSMAYAILRENGVSVGKMDFVGPTRSVPA